MVSIDTGTGVVGREGRKESSGKLTSTGGNSMVLDESVSVTRAVSAVLVLSKLDREEADNGGEPKHSRVSSPWQSGSSGSALRVLNENLASGSNVLCRGLGGDSNPVAGNDGTGATGVAASLARAKIGRGAGRPVLGNGSDFGLVYGPLVENGTGLVLVSPWKLSKGVVGGAA